MWGRAAVGAGSCGGVLFACSTCHATPRRPCLKASAVAQAAHSHPRPSNPHPPSLTVRPGGTLVSAGAAAGRSCAGQKQCSPGHEGARSACVRCPPALACADPDPCRHCCPAGHVTAPTSRPEGAAAVEAAPTAALAPTGAAPLAAAPRRLLATRPPAPPARAPPRCAPPTLRRTPAGA